MLKEGRDYRRAGFKGNILAWGNRLLEREEVTNPFYYWGTRVTSHLGNIAYRR